MTKKILIFIAISLASSFCEAFDPEGMYVESYWESWVFKDYPDDYCALLKDVPATPVGSLTGVNYVGIGINHAK